MGFDMLDKGKGGMVGRDDVGKFSKLFYLLF
jgi:hypothetical protein